MATETHAGAVVTPSKLCYFFVLFAFFPQFLLKGTVCKKCTASYHKIIPYVTRD